MRSRSILLALFLAVLALALTWPAMAQDTIAALPTSDAGLIDLAGRLGLPGVLLVLGLQLGRTLGGLGAQLSAWRPKVEVTLICPHQACLEEIDRRLNALQHQADRVEAREEIRAERTSEEPRLSVR